MKGLPLTIAALMLSAGLAWAECPTGLGGGQTYVLDMRGVLTLTACDQTWVRSVEYGRQVRILAGHMTVVAGPTARLQLGGGGINLTPQGRPMRR